MVFTTLITKENHGILLSAPLEAELFLRWLPVDGECSQVRLGKDLAYDKGNQKRRQLFEKIESIVFGAVFVLTQP